MIEATYKRPESLAKREFSSDTIEKIDSECDNFEKAMGKSGVQDKYIKSLEFLERKYK